jgi:hypothetical protein
VLFVDVRTIWVTSWVGRTLFFKALLVVLVKDVPGLLATLNSTDECSPGPFHGDVFFLYENPCMIRSIFSIQFNVFAHPSVLGKSKMLAC